MMGTWDTWDGIVIIRRFVGMLFSWCSNLRFEKLLLISELPECYKPGKSPILMIEKGFIKRFLSFNCRVQLKPSFTVSETNLISPRAENCFIWVTSLPRHVASNASAPMFCFSFGGVIIVWRVSFPQSADTQEFIANFNCLGQWHIAYNKNSKKKKKAKNLNISV